MKGQECLRFGDLIDEVFIIRKRFKNNEVGYYNKHKKRFHHRPFAWDEFVFHYRCDAEKVIEEIDKPINY